MTGLADEPVRDAARADTPRMALAFSFVERYAVVLVYAVSNIVLSRLLTPHDTGLFTIGFALTVMIGTFRDFGVATYILQEPELTDRKWRSALGVTTVMSLAVFAALVATAFGAGAFYHDPAVTRIMLVSGLTLLLIPFNAVILMWLRREMRYRVLARISLAGAATQACVTVALAASGWGAMSMAWGSVANSAASLVLSIACRPRQYGYRPTLAGWRPIAGFGLYSTIGSICSEITPNGNDLFVGRFAGLPALGQFSKGMSLAALVNQSLVNAILPVAMTLFAARRRAGLSLAEALPQALALLTGVTWPAFAGLSIIAAPLIHILFGPQWNAAIVPAHVVVFAAAFTSMTAMHASVYAATGAMRPRMTVQLLVTPVQLVLLFVAARHGLLASAYATVLSAAIEFTVSELVVNRLCGTPMRSILAALLPSAAVTATTAAAAGFAFRRLPPAHGDLVLPLACAVASGVAGWGLGLWISGHPLGREIRAALTSAGATLAKRAF